jgi:GTP-binding protein Era
MNADTAPGAEFRSGFVAVIGRPNVGKSTLVNALMGQKIAAVSPRPQTTRRRQMGILTTAAYQMVFLDTPGLHTPRHKLGEFLNQEAEDALAGVDAVLWLVDVSQLPGDEDRRIAALLAQLRRRPPLILGLNKADLVTPGLLAERSAAYADLVKDASVLSFSAVDGRGCPALLEALSACLPQRPPEFDLDQITDFYEREIAADLVREACLNHLRDEVPHGINVRIDEFTERGGAGAYIAATIFVERESQKGIVIGEGGLMLKRIGSSARGEIESMSGRKVFLQLRVKVEKDWRDDEHALRRFGYKLEKKKRR